MAMICFKREFNIDMYTYKRFLYTHFSLLLLLPTTSQRKPAYNF